VPDQPPAQQSILPKAMAVRAREFRDSGAVPAAARDAATVVLLRDGRPRPGTDAGAGRDAGRDASRDGGRVEAYLLRRAPTLAFAAGMYVFPGGSVDPRDGDAETAWTGPPPAEWAARFGCAEPLARSLVCAAVRETFEESGVLLAGDPATGAVVADTTGAGWEADRLALLDGGVSLSGLLSRRGLSVRADLLRAWTHWITPAFEPRRFDTRFFVAALPTGQRTRDVGGEADRVLWCPAVDAVRRCESGEMEMLPPTVTTLREVAACATVADVLGAAEHRRIAPIQPRLVWSGDDMRFVLPGEAGYEEAVS
jgi:8-oxo-dGTP pyrophosphatase MutT (NUDIX family)